MVKVLEVEVARKRIALSIKQTQDPPAQRQGKSAAGRRDTAKPTPKDAPVSMNDALSALKNKFGR